MKFATLSLIHDLLKAEEARAQAAADEARIAMNAASRRIDRAEEAGEDPTPEALTVYDAAKAVYRTASTAYNRAAEALADFIAADFR